MLAQFTQSRRLLIIPLWSFSRLSEEAGDPPADVEYVGICNSARSGSTLLTQVWCRVPSHAGFPVWGPIYRPDFVFPSSTHANILSKSHVIFGFFFPDV